MNTIITNLKHPIIMILDDLDTIKLSLSNQTEEYLKFISKVARVIKDNFSSLYISFIFSLDKHFIDLRGSRITLQVDPHTGHIS